MKNRELGRFWSLRPRFGAAQLEMGFAAVAVALLLTLLAQPASRTPLTQASAAPAAPTAFFENPLAPPRMLPQACIKRVLAVSRKQLHFDLVGVMERDCFGVVPAPSSRLVARVPTCLQPPGWHLTHGRRLATGCLMN